MYLTVPMMLTCVLHAESTLDNHSYNTSSHTSSCHTLLASSVFRDFLKLISLISLKMSESVVVYYTRIVTRIEYVLLPCHLLVSLLPLVCPPPHKRLPTKQKKRLTLLDESDTLCQFTKSVCFPLSTMLIECCYQLDLLLKPATRAPYMLYYTCTDSVNLCPLSPVSYYLDHTYTHHKIHPSTLR